MIRKSIILITIVATASRSIAEERAPVVLTDQARQLHESALVIDGHNDLPWEIRTEGSFSFDRLDIANPQPSLQTDIPRLKEGGMGAQFWSVWVPVETSLRGESLRTTLEEIDLVRTMIDRYPETFELALSADDIVRIADQGKIASLIGVEGGHSIENSLAVLRQLYKLGARYMTLTHSKGLDWADSCTDVARHGGLTEFGEEVVREMNRMGMMVDLSHVSPDTMKDAIRVSKAPVIFSHSSSRAVADHPRNVPDDVLRRVRENRGVVMVNFFSVFIVPEAADRDVQRYALLDELEAKYEDPERARAEANQWYRKEPIPRGTIHTLIDHIDHIAKVAGVDCVGLGSDYDGVSILPEQLEDVSSFPYITQALMDRGYDDEAIRKILGGNLLRVMRAVEAAAESSSAP